MTYEALSIDARKQALRILKQIYDDVRAIPAPLTERSPRTP